MNHQERDVAQKRNLVEEMRTKLREVHSNTEADATAMVGSRITSCLEQLRFILMIVERLQECGKHLFVVEWEKKDGN